MAKSKAAPPGIVSLTDGDEAGYAAAIASGDADFAAGRFKSLEQVKANTKERFGITLEGSKADDINCTE